MTNGMDLYARELAKAAIGKDTVDQEYDPQSTSAQSGYAVAEAVAQSSGKVINIGNSQYSYNDYILPSISVTILKQVYEDDIKGIPQILEWDLYGSKNYLKILSSDHIGVLYSIDVLIHNQFHCAYTWEDNSSGNINPSVIPKDWQQVQPTVLSNSFYIKMEGFTECQVKMTNSTSSTINISATFHENLNDGPYNGTSIQVFPAAAGAQVWGYEANKTIGFEKYHKLDSTSAGVYAHTPLAGYIAFPVNSNISYKFYVK